MWYLKSAFDTYQKVKDGVQSRLGEVQSTILSPADTLKNFLSPTPSSHPRAESEVETLREQVAELERQLKKGARVKPRKRTKS